LNGGVFLLSLLFFDFVLIPALRNVIIYFMGESPLWNLIQTTLSWIFSFIWVVPLFVLSKVINTFWFQDIAGELELGASTTECVVLIRVCRPQMQLLTIEKGNLR
jgi:hypothetical protein